MILSPLVISNTRFTPGLHGMNSAEIAALGDSVMRTFFVKEAVALQELESVPDQHKPRANLSCISC